MSMRKQQVSNDRGRRALGALASIGLVLAGCANLQREAEEIPVQPVEEPAPVQPEAPDVPEGSVVDAIEWIEAGDMDRALLLLDRLAEEGRSTPTVRLLARQLRESPQELLPGPYREIELAAGESLSQLAQREIGNPLYFVALARLNSIAVPRRVAAGARLRVPVHPIAQSTDATRTAEGSAAGDRSGSTGEEIERDLMTVADYLVASGQDDQALRLLGSTLAEGGGSQALQARFVDIGLSRIEALESEQAWSAARGWLQEAIELVEEPALQQRLHDAERRLATVELVAQAQAEFEQGRLEDSLVLARQALEQSPDDQGVIALERELRERWTGDLHAEALRAWRQRDVDLSIRIWQHLLERVPDFEPAAVYLERALELRRRLQY